MEGKILPALVLSLLCLFGCTGRVDAKAELEQASLYFDNDTSFNCIKQTKDILTYAVTTKAVNMNACQISGNYDSDAGKASSSSMIYFNASDFGLKNFNNCDISCDIYCDIGADIADISFCTDGATCISERITPVLNKWSNYTISNADEGNNVVGIYVKMNKSYQGDLFRIDNLVIKTPDGTIAHAKDVNDYVALKSKNLYMDVFMKLCVFAIVLTAAHFIRKHFFYFW